MASTVRLMCDRCGGESLLPTFGTLDHAREIHARDGWKHTGCDIHCKQHPDGFDICPECAGTNPDYYAAEPF